MRKFNHVAPKGLSSEGTSFKILAAHETPELRIMDAVGADMFGEGIRATEVRDFLAEYPGNVTARINSFGGDVYEGLAILNAFLDHGNVTGVVDGIAFSAAAILAMGCQELHMNMASDFGIHRAWTITAGNRNELAAAIEWLDLVDQHQIDLFSQKTGASPEQVEQWLNGTDDGTIWSASQAFELGFCDRVLDQAAQPVAAVSRGTQIAAASRAIYQQRKKALTRNIRRK